LYRPNRPVDNNDSQPAKKLPKWQAGRPNCQNGSHSKSCAKTYAKLAAANSVPNKIIFPPIFFIGHSSIELYNTDIKSKKERVKDVERLLWCGCAVSGHLLPLWRAL
jgi:hypothetical protein